MICALDVQLSGFKTVQNCPMGANIECAIKRVVQLYGLQLRGFVHSAKYEEKIREPGNDVQLGGLCNYTGCNYAGSTVLIFYTSYEVRVRVLLPR
jgi:hypothetical protein